MQHEHLTTAISRMLTALAVVPGFMHEKTQTPLLSPSLSDVFGFLPE
jgi:hypothetical protein